jgi:diamine N-acetyltransferase
MVASDSTIFLREVNNDNFWPVITLSVHEAQEKMVASNAMSIAQAYFNREIAWFRAIYADDEPVGFLMLEDRAEKQEYFLWRLMVDAKYQGMGFGRKAMKLLIEHVKTRPGAVELRTSYVPGEGSPGPFYHKLGFEETGEILEGERVVSLKLTYADGDGPKPSSEESTDQILHLMKEFQEGYSQRDLSNLDAFMELFAPDGEVEVIGTNAITPGKGEWCQGREAVRQLVRGDWEHW